MSSINDGGTVRMRQSSPCTPQPGPLCLETQHRPARGRGGVAAGPGPVQSRAAGGERGGNCREPRWRAAPRTPHLSKALSGLPQSSSGQAACVQDRGRGVPSSGPISNPGLCDSLGNESPSYGGSSQGARAAAS